MDHDSHVHHRENMSEPTTVRVYRPLLIVLGAIFVASFLMAWVRDDLAGAELMRLFMGNFFVTFAFFKLLDLKGFADAYAEYDLIASRSRIYALLYPFIEAVLGIAYLAAWQLPVVNIVTLVVMIASSAGVLNALLGKQKIRCACLGAVIRLPMTTVTLIEDLGMATMAAIMLFV